jgi:UDP-N-acetylglucosamine 2-epimerase (non-hydrolysing)
MNRASLVTGRFQIVPPLPYRAMVRALRGATLVATDSGGVQEETTALGVPCLTLRENTERPITVSQGTNTVVGLDPARIAEETRKILGGAGKRGRLPEGWDGHAAERIVDAIERRYA